MLTTWTSAELAALGHRDVVVAPVNPAVEEDPSSRCAGLTVRYHRADFHMQPVAPAENCLNRENPAVARTKHV